MPARYRAILFDLDDTLRITLPPFLDRLRLCLEEAGYRPLAAEWPELERWIHWYWAGSPEIREDADRYGQEGVWPAFWQRLLGKMGYPGLEDVARGLAEHFLEAYRPCSAPRPAAYELLAALRQQDVILGVLSNRGSAFDDELHALGLAAFFDFTFHAGAVNAFKPNPKVFQAALRVAGVPPAEAVYIGDNYFADVVGARAAGMHAILLDDRGLYSDVTCPVVRGFEELWPYLVDGEEY